MEIIKKDGGTLEKVRIYYPGLPTGRRRKKLEAADAILLIRLRTVDEVLIVDSEMSSSRGPRTNGNFID